MWSLGTCLVVHTSLSQISPRVVPRWRHRLMRQCSLQPSLYSRALTMHSGRMDWRQRSTPAAGSAASLLLNSQPSSAGGCGAAASYGSAAPRSSGKPKPHRSSVTASAAANTVPYTITEEQRQVYAAAGVLFYTVSPSRQVQVLLMLQSNKDGWSILGGKVDRADQPRTPEQTAAREVWEETHKLIPQEALPRLLASSPQTYYKAGRYCLFLVRLEGAELLPVLYKQRVAEGQLHPAADTCMDLGWFDLDRVNQSAAFFYRRFDRVRAHKQLCDEAEEAGLLPLRRVALDLQWKVVSGWLKQLAGGRCREVVLRWQSPGDAPARSSSSNTSSSSSSTGNSHSSKEGAATHSKQAAAADAGAGRAASAGGGGGGGSSHSRNRRQQVIAMGEAAKQWQRTHEMLTDMLEGMQIQDGAPASGGNGAGSSSGSSSSSLAAPGASQQQHGHAHETR